MDCVVKTDIRRGWVSTNNEDNKTYYLYSNCNYNTISSEKFWIDGNSHIFLISSKGFIGGDRGFLSSGVQFY